MKTSGVSPRKLTQRLTVLGWVIFCGLLEPKSQASALTETLSGASKAVACAARYFLERANPWLRSEFKEIPAFEGDPYQTLIRRAEQDQSQGVDPAAVPWPVFPRGSVRYKRAVILIHGLSDSPFTMTEHLSSVYASHGIAVIPIRLKGHGTRPEDLLDVRLAEWRKQVVDALSIARAIGDEIFVAGYSTGGGLALDAAATYLGITQVDLFAPMVAILNKSSIFTGIVELSGNAYDHKAVAAPHSYSKISLNGVWQVSKLEARLVDLRKRPRIRARVRAVMSLADTTVKNGATLELLSAHRVPETQLLRVPGVHHRNILSRIENPHLDQILDFVGNGLRTSDTP